MLYPDFSGQEPACIYPGLIESLRLLKGSIGDSDLYMLKSRLDVAIVSITNIQDLVFFRQKPLSLLETIKTRSMLSEIKDCLKFINSLKIADTHEIIRSLDMLIFSISIQPGCRIN